MSPFRPGGTASSIRASSWAFAGQVQLLGSTNCAALLVILIAQAGGAEVTSRVIQLALALGCFTASTANLRDVRDIKADKIDGIKTFSSPSCSGPACLAWALSVTLSLTSAALLLSLQSSGASVTAAIWVYMALTWESKGTALPNAPKLRNSRCHEKWLTFSVPIALLSTPCTSLLGSFAMGIQSATLFMPIM